MRNACIRRYTREDAFGEAAEIELNSWSRNPGLFAFVREIQGFLRLACLRRMFAAQSALAETMR
jgi:hypothetical protein